MMWQTILFALPQPILYNYSYIPMNNLKTIYIHKLYAPVKKPNINYAKHKDTKYKNRK
jgi:hypothetical protein